MFSPKSHKIAQTAAPIFGWPNFGGALQQNWNTFVFFFVFDFRDNFYPRPPAFGPRTGVGCFVTVWVLFFTLPVCVCVCVRIHNTSVKFHKARSVKMICDFATKIHHPWTQPKKANKKQENKSKKIETISVIIQLSGGNVKTQTHTYTDKHAEVKKHKINK